MIYILIFILGAAIGSFLNVAICRLPEKKSLIKNRSACPHCHEIIKVRDLIPILSFFFLRGKCRKCHKPISWQYPIVEICAGLLFVFLFQHYDGILALVNPVFYRDLVFASALIVVFVTDWRFMLIMDAVTIPLMVFAFGANIFILVRDETLSKAIISLLLAAAVGGGIFWLQYFISKGKWIGMGDILLGLAMGLMLGWPNIALALFLSYVLGAFVGSFLLLFGIIKLHRQMPFGVFLSIGTFVALVYGEAIMGWYLRILK